LGGFVDLNIVRVKNRTNQNLEFLYDGQVYKFPASKTVPVVRTAADHAVRKSMALWDPETGQCVYRLGIVGEHDVSPLEMEVTSKTELLDRSLIEGSKDAKQVNVGRGEEGQRAFLGPQALATEPAAPAGDAPEEEDQWDEPVKDSSG
jgi:hypothetical protein